MCISSSPQDYLPVRMAASSPAYLFCIFVKTATHVPSLMDCSVIVHSSLLEQEVVSVDISAHEQSPKGRSRGEGQQNACDMNMELGGTWYRKP